MKRLAIILMTVTALTFPVAGTSAQHARGNTVCGQLHGPYVAWKDVTPFGTAQYKGSTWTIVASGMRCSRAMAMAPAMLRVWSGARQRKFPILSGWRCWTLPDQGRLTCVILVAPVGGKGVSVWMLAPLTLAEIKKRFGG